MTGVRKGADEVSVWAVLREVGVGTFSCGVGEGSAFGSGAAFAVDRRRREDTAMDSGFIMSFFLYLRFWFKWSSRVSAWLDFILR